MLNLSIVIPCYNEEYRLPATLQSIHDYLIENDLSAEIIIVDDGSTDRTVGVAKKFQDILPDLWILHFAKNQGKGFAVKQGMLAAQGDAVLFMDADNATKLSEIEKLWPYLGNHDVVIGSRAQTDSELAKKQPWYRRLLGRAGNLLIQSALVPGINDTQCGFKLFRKQAINAVFGRQQTMGYGSDIEILTIAQRLGYRVKEVGITWRDAKGSKVRPMRDAWRTLIEVLRIKYNLVANNYHLPSPLTFSTT